MELIARHVEVRQIVVLLLDLQGLQGKLAALLLGLGQPAVEIHLLPLEMVILLAQVEKLFLQRHLLGQQPVALGFQRRRRAPQLLVLAQQIPQVLPRLLADAENIITRAFPIALSAHRRPPFNRRAGS